MPHPADPGPTPGDPYHQCSDPTAAVGPGGTVYAGAGWWDQPGEIGVWDLATHKPLQRFTEDLGVASVALSPDGKLLASGSWTGHVRIRDWARTCSLRTSTGEAP